MGFFDLFKSKPALPERKDISWMTEGAKWKGLERLLQAEPKSLVLAWFPRTKEKAESIVQGFTGAELRMCREVLSAQAFSRIYILEHYPMLDKETEFLRTLHGKEIVFLNSLDEPLFMQFGGERIRLLMEKLGMEENESIEHSMVSSSIINMQKKVQEKVALDFSAPSQEEWIRRMNG